MKRKSKSRAAREAIRETGERKGAENSAVAVPNVYPGLMGIEIGVPYSRRFGPPYVSGHGVREEDEVEEDYDICQ